MPPGIDTNPPLSLEAATVTPARESVAIDSPLALVDAHQEPYEPVRSELGVAAVSPAARGRRAFVSNVSGAERHARPATQKRLVRFAVQAPDGVGADELRHRIDRCLAADAGQHLPDLVGIDASFWDYHAKVGRPWSPRVDPRAAREKPPYLLNERAVARRRAQLQAGRAPGIPFRLDSLGAELKRRPAKHAPGLARFNFFVLTLPLYESEHKRSQCNPSGALFDVAYALETGCKLVSATPDLRYPNYELLSGDKDKGGKGLPGRNTPCPDGTADVRWHLDNINYDAVPPQITGSGVAVGHPDTGWTPHSELNFSGGPDGRTSPNFVVGSDINVIDPNAASGAEELVPSPPGQIPLTRQRYHGTATAGLIVSDAATGGLDPNTDDMIRGLATGANIVSIRCVDGVILIGDLDVAQAVLAAVQAGSHVISISLGGYPAPVLEWAIQLAVANDVIVVAAAGNYYPFVVYPAAYSSCIGVAGSTINDAVWSGSARNQQLELPCPIDISAPAECVWAPFWNDAGNETRVRSNGTSFATAIVAGAAALWLQQNDRDTLIAQLDGRVPLQELFRSHLAITARRPSGWNVVLDGPGILDLSGLMQQSTLPDPSTFGSLTYALGILGDGLDSFGGGMRGLFEETLNGAADLGNEVVTIIMTDPIVATTVQGIVTAINSGKEVVADAIAGGQDALDEAQETLQDAVDGIADAVEDVIDAVAEAASDAASKAVKTATNTVKSVAGLFGF